MSDEILIKIDKFFAEFGPRKYSKGQILIFSGDETKDVYYITKGKVKQYDVTNRGDEIILNVFKPPAFFPMSLAISQQTSPFIFEAETDIEVRLAPAVKVVEFVKNNPDVMFDLLDRLYRGVDGLLGRMVNLMSGSANNRLIYELIIEARRFGKPQKANQYLLEISEKQLGARAGLSRETVSREIHKLKASNLVEVRTKDILINDLPALENKLTR